MKKQTKSLSDTRQKKGGVTKVKKDNPKITLVSISDLARVTGVEIRMMRHLQQQGIIEPKSVSKGAGNKYEFERCVFNIIKYYREKADRRQSGGGDMESTKLKLMEVKLKKEELELAELDGDLHKTVDIERVMGAALTRLRINLLSIPMGVAPVIRDKKNVNEIAEIINDRICRALNEIATVDIDKMMADESEPS